MAIESTGKFLSNHYLKYIGIRPHLASLAFVMTLTIPICQRLASEVYVDLGLLFFSTLSLIYFLYWKNSQFQSQKFFCISAIAAGMALGTKYNGLLILAILSLLCLFAFGHFTKRYKKALLYSCQFVVIAIILASPWLIRNYIISGGNPFFPLLTSIFPENINEANPLYPVLNHTILYRMIAGESITDILLLPFRIFFDGEDHNFLRFDGKLNPMMMMLIPLAFIFRKGHQSSPEPPESLKNAERTTTHLVSDQFILIVFTVSIIICSFSRDIRIRYLIPIVSPIVMLNIFSIDNFLSRDRKLFNYVMYVSVGIYLAYNTIYGYGLLRQIDHMSYLAGKESKESYLHRKVSMYPIYDYINTSTEKQSVIYDVMSGHRSYYVDRIYIHHPSHVDTVFMNYLIQKKSYIDYEQYLAGLKTYHGARVTHLLIRPYLLIRSYKEIFPAYDQEAILNFIQFLNRHDMLLQSGDARLYELVTWQTEQTTIRRTKAEVGG